MVGIIGFGGSHRLADDVAQLTAFIKKVLHPVQFAICNLQFP
jgi:hypothetical protein